MVLFKIANLKVSLKTSAIVLDNVSVDDWNIKRYKNYIVIKTKYTYTIFKPNSKGVSHINITKIPSFDLVLHAAEYLRKVIDFKTKDLIIDNIIAIANAEKKLDLSEICKSGKLPILKYNNETFPGLFVKFSVGTAILFHSGKIVIVGCKNKNQIECLIASIYAAI